MPLYEYVSMKTNTNTSVMCAVAIADCVRHKSVVIVYGYACVFPSTKMGDLLRLDTLAAVLKNMKCMV